MSLPTGTVTLLFTDIEGSTKRWEQDAQAMRAALKQHDATMRQAISAHQGHVFKTIGDAFCAVFQRADEAVLACMDAQRKLREIEIPAEMGGAIRVRMAIHTGETDERDGDYFGPAVNRVARLLAIGHGEQVLVSSTTHDVAHRWLPGEVKLRDMGVHRLKDLAESERVYQMMHPELRADFPPLRSAQSHPNNLPRELSSFVGRADDIARLQTLLKQTSLLTLTGSGGCGKSRLAMKVAQSMLDSFVDGVWFTELGPLSDPALVPREVLGSLGLREHPGKTVTEALIEHLRQRSVLLVIDGCEHLLSACAQLAREILRACPNVKILASSREPLRAEGEATYRIPSLALPADSDSRDLAALAACESVALFIERARSAKPNFVLTESNAQAVARICRRLDGIPLAIELAAARVKVLAVEQINARLDDRFRLLTGGSRTALMRYQTLHAAIAWSYDMLSDEEKRLLRMLSVFAGGWTLEAAAGVCFPNESGGSSSPPDEYEVLDLLTRLVDKSLVAVDEQGDRARYALLETVRQFAREEAAGQGELDPGRGRHLQYFLSLAEQAEPKLTGPEQAQWLESLDNERENLLAAIEFSRTLPDKGETGMSLAGSIWRFWEIRGYLSVGSSALKNLLALPDENAKGLGIAKALNAAGSLALTCGDYDEARDLLERSLSMREALGDQKGTADSNNSLGLIDWRQGDYSAARSRWERCLAIRREIGDTTGIAASLNNVGLVAWEQGDFPAARMQFEEALALNRKQGNRAWVAAQLNNLGGVMVNLADPPAARRFFEEALHINRELGNRAWIVTNLGGLGEVSYQLGDFEASRTYFEDSLRLAREVGDKVDAAEALRHLARVALQQKRMDDALKFCAEAMKMYRESGSRPQIAKCFELLGALWSSGDAETGRRGARLLGAAAELRKAIGFPVPPAEKKDYLDALECSKKMLGPETFETALAEGSQRLEAEGWERIAAEAMGHLPMQ